MRIMSHRLKENEDTQYEVYKEPKTPRPYSTIKPDAEDKRENVSAFGRQYSKAEWNPYGSWQEKAIAEILLLASQRIFKDMDLSRGNVIEGIEKGYNKAKCEMIFLLIHQKVEQYLLLQLVEQQNVVAKMVSTVIIIQISEFAINQRDLGYFNQQHLEFPTSIFYDEQVSHSTFELMRDFLFFIYPIYLVFASVHNNGRDCKRKSQQLNSLACIILQQYILVCN